MQIQKIGVIGRGAVGTLFTSLIQKEVKKENIAVLVDEKRLQSYQENAFYCNDEKCDFNYVSKVEDFAKVDLLLIMVKYPYLQEALTTVAPFVKKDTIILSLLNGITSEKIVEETLQKGIVLHSIAQLMDALKEGNHVTYTKTGEIVVGTNDESKKEALQIVTSFFDRIAFPYTQPKDIIHAQWSKLMLNCAINQICAVYDVPYRNCQTGGNLHSLFVDTMKEVQMIANLEKIMITDEEVGNWIVGLDNLSADSMPSMRQDTLAKRKTEVDLFSKTIIELSKKHHVEVPINTDLYNKIKMIEEEY